MTDACVAALQRITSQPDPPGSFLRVSVDAGGCFGFQYNYHLADDLSPDEVSHRPQKPIEVSV